MAKLVYSAGNLTKSISCVDTSLVNKPYISINGQGCIPLTAQTSTGIKVQINGQEYSPISTMLSTKATTITHTYEYDEFIMGESKTTLFVNTVLNRSMSFKGNARSHYTTKSTSWSQEYKTYNNSGSTMYELLGMTSGTDPYTDTSWETLYSTDKWDAWFQSGNYGMNDTAIHSHINNKNGVLLYLNNANSNQPFFVIDSQLTSTSYKTGSKASYYSSTVTTTASFVLCGGPDLHVKSSTYEMFNRDIAVVQLANTTRCFNSSGSTMYSSIDVSYMTAYTPCRSKANSAVQSGYNVATAAANNTFTLSSASALDWDIVDQIGFNVTSFWLGTSGYVSAGRSMTLTIICNGGRSSSYGGAANTFSTFSTIIDSNFTYTFYRDQIDSYMTGFGYNTRAYSTLRSTESNKLTFSFSDNARNNRSVHFSLGNVSKTSISFYGPFTVSGNPRALELFGYMYLGFSTYNPVSKSLQTYDTRTIQKYNTLYKTLAQTREYTYTAFTTYKKTLKIN